MDSINPTNGSFGAQGPNQSNQEPENVIQDMLGLWLILTQGNVEWENDNEKQGGNCSTGQMIANYITNFIQTVQSQGSNASSLDLSLMYAFQAGNPSIASLAQKISAAASANPPSTDTSDIATMINLLESNSGASAITLIGNWFNQANVGNSLQWSGDNSQLQFMMNTVINELGPLIAGMENSNNTFSEQATDARAYAQQIINLYEQMKQFPNNPYAQVFENFMNTLVATEGDSSLYGWMNEFANPSFTPTQAQLQDFINIVDPDGSNYAQWGFQGMLQNLLQAMEKNGMFQNGPNG